MDAETRLRQMPETMRATYRLAMAGRSKAAAIRAFCCECTGWSRAEVRDCTDTGCPLFKYRPYRKGKAGGGADKVAALEREGGER